MDLSLRLSPMSAFTAMINKGLVGFCFSGGKETNYADFAVGQGDYSLGENRR